MQMLEYLGSVPWRRMLLGWVPRSRPYDATSRCVIYRARDVIYCTGFVCEGKDALWSVDHFSSYPCDETENWASTTVEIPRKISERYLTFLVPSGATKGTAGLPAFHFGVPPLNIKNEPPALTVDVGPENEVLRGIEKFAELNKLPLDLVTVAGITMAQAWFHQQEQWAENEVRILYGDDGLGMFSVLASSKGIHSFGIIQSEDYLLETLNGFVNTAGLDCERIKVWTAVDDADWEKARSVLRSDGLFQNLAMKDEYRIKVQFGGPRIPDVGALGSNSVFPQIRNAVLSTLPLWPLE